MNRRRSIGIILSAIGSLFLPRKLFALTEKKDDKEFEPSTPDTVGAFPESSVNWKKEWQKHLEEKHG